MTRGSMAYSEADIARIVAQPGYRVVGEQRPRACPQSDPVVLPPVVHETRQHRPCWPYRSRLEQQYAMVLDQWVQDGLLVRWRYEALRLTLAPRITLTVDFCLTLTAGVGDGRLQLHETKGAWHRDDGWIKLKQAAALYPEFRFLKVTCSDHQWSWQEVPSGRQTDAEIASLSPDHHHWRNSDRG